MRSTLTCRVLVFAHSTNNQKGLMVLTIEAGSKPSPGPGPSPSPPPPTPPTPTPSKIKSLIKIKDGKQKGGKFVVTNDPVMGGASVSNFTVQSSEEGRWAGEVKIVQKLHAPGFCRLDADFEKVDVSGYAGIWIEGSTDGSGSAVTEKLMVVLSGKTLLGEFQFTAPMPPLAPGRNTYFVAFETFRPFTIRPGQSEIRIPLSSLPRTCREAAGGGASPRQHRPLDAAPSRAALSCC